MGAEFQVGTLSISMAKMLAIGCAAYTIATMGHARTGLAEKLPDRWSAVATTAVMAALTWTLWTHGPAWIPAPYSFVVLGMFMAGLLITLGYSLSNAQRKLEELRAEMGKVLDEWRSTHLPADRREAWLEARRRLSFGDEGRRKTPHLLSGVVLIVYLGLGGAMVRLALQADQGANAEVTHNLQAALDAGWLGAGHMASLVLILGVLFMVLPVEFVRLKFPELGYPFKGTIEGTLREKERGLFGAHYYIAAGGALAVLWLGHDSSQWPTMIPAIMAMVCITVFADAASALFGVKWGRKKLPHHAGKTWVGSFGGTAVAFVVALPFVGVPVAVLGAAVFFGLDLLAPVPVPISDNILNPLGLTLAFLLAAPWIDPLMPFY